MIPECSDGIAIACITGTEQENILYFLHRSDGRNIHAQVLGWQESIVCIYLLGCPGGSLILGYGDACSGEGIEILAAGTYQLLELTILTYLIPGYSIGRSIHLAI